MPLAPPQVTHRLISRPTPGRLVVRTYPRPMKVTSHRAWQIGDQVVTHCGRRYPAGPTRFRLFVLSVDLVTVTCRNCLAHT